MARFIDLSQLLHSEATNFSAYPRKCVDVVKNLSEPPATKCLSEKKLRYIRLASNKFKKLCHNQVVKQLIKLVLEASSKVIGF